MSARCSVCMVLGKTEFYQKCSDCGAVFCPACNGQKKEPYTCPKCHSQNIQLYPGTITDLNELM